MEDDEGYTEIDVGANTPGQWVKSFGSTPVDTTRISETAGYRGIGEDAAQSVGIEDIGTVAGGKAAVPTLEPLPYSNKGLLGLQRLMTMKNPYDRVLNPHKGDLNLISNIIGMSDRSNPFMSLANIPMMYMLGKTQAAAQDFEKQREENIKSWTEKHEKEISEGIDQQEKIQQARAKYQQIQDKFKQDIAVYDRARDMAFRLNDKAGANAYARMHGVDVDFSNIESEADKRKHEQDFQWKKMQEHDDNMFQLQMQLEEGRFKRTQLSEEGRDRRTAATIAGMLDRVDRAEAYREKRDKEKGDKQSPEYKDFKTHLKEYQEAERKMIAEGKTPEEIRKAMSQEMTTLTIFADKAGEDLNKWLGMKAPSKKASTRPSAKTPPPKQQEVPKSATKEEIAETRVKEETAYTGRDWLQPKDYDKLPPLQKTRYKPYYGGAKNPVGYQKKKAGEK